MPLKTEIRQMATIIDGKLVSAKVRSEIRSQIDELRESGRRIPCLAVILVGDDAASAVYVRNKARACTDTGIISRQITLPGDSPESVLLGHIMSLNADPDVDGILVQLPLPPHINSKTVTESISPEKDVDAFHPVNVGLSRLGAPSFLPCTPAGIIRLLDEYSIDICGNDCVVIGRSNIVGKPVSDLLLARNGTVTVCHSKTKDLSRYTKQADILVAAVGKPRIITGDMIKEGCAVIDVGINRTENGLCGDCDYESCAEKAAFITPVPGGVGPMTIAMLLQNTLTAYGLHNR